MSEITVKLMKATGFTMLMLSMENDGLPLLIPAYIQKFMTLCKLVMQSDIADIPLHATSDRIFEIPELSDEDRQKDWIYAPVKFTPQQIRENLKKIQVMPI